MVNYPMITETYNEHNGHIELLYTCDSPGEAVRLHEVATRLGFKCFPKSSTLVNYNSRFLRILVKDAADKVLLKLAF